MCITSAKRRQLVELGSLNKKETYIANVQRAVGGRLISLINGKPDG
jgi:hypothetical protein